MPSFTRESGGTLHVAVMGVNRISKDDTIPPPAAVEDAQEPLSVDVTEAPTPIESADTPVGVEDSEAPWVVVPGNITLETEPGQNYAIVEYEAPEITDNVGATSGPILIAGLNAGSPFPVETTTVTYEAHDAAGNIGTASFTVTVRDTEAPMMTVPTDIMVNTEAGQNYAVVTYEGPSATDNVGVSSGPTLTAGLGSGGQFPIGTTIVTYEVADDAGNSAIVSFTVVVEGAVQNNAPTRRFISRF